MVPQSWRAQRDRLIGAEGMNGESTRLVMWVYYLALCLVWTGLLTTQITDSKLRPDALQNVRMASHLAHYGIISMDREDPPSLPSMHREPIPIVTLAAWILADPETKNARPYTKLYEGRPLASLKRINLIWSFFIQLGICVLVFLSSKNLIWRLTVPPFIIVLTNFSFLNYFVNQLLTEVQGACFLVWTAVFMLLFVRSPTVVRGIAVAVGFACLALTKAVFFYISFVALVVLALLLIARRDGAQKLSFYKTASLLGVVLVCYLALVTPWMLRNAIELGHFNISGRGGDVLYFRVLLMERPILGSLYVYSRGPYRKRVGKLLGYKPKDLKPGGDLEVFHKDAPRELKRRRWEIYEARMKAAGVSYRSRMDFASQLTREALKSYLAHPSHFLVWPFVFAYKSSFFMLGVIKETTDARWALNMRFDLSLLLVLNFMIVGIGSLLRLRAETCAVFLMSIGFFLFHALFSHCPLRYFQLLVPMVWLAAAFSVGFAFQSTRAFGQRIGWRPGLLLSYLRPAFVRLATRS